jgi:hypothetical protein
VIGEVAAGREFSAVTRDILREAARKIRVRADAGHHALFAYWQTTMAKICTVDAFCVGIYKPGRAIIYPYNYDHGGYDYPEVHTYGDDSPAAWMKENRRTYTYSSDGGALLNRGVSFGQTSRLSADAVTVPLMATSDAALLGIASMQSYRSGSYTMEHVRAFEWTARWISRSLTHQSEDADLLAELDPINESANDFAVRVVEEVCGNLRRLRSAMEQAEATPPVDAAELAGRLGRLRDMCERIETDTMALLIQPGSDSLVFPASLTPREREVARMLMDGLRNAEIANQLSVSVATVKTHVHNIRKKFGEAGRGDIPGRIRK